MASLNQKGCSELLQNALPAVAASPCGWERAAPVWSLAGSLRGGGAGRRHLEKRCATFRRQRPGLTNPVAGSTGSRSPLTACRATASCRSYGREAVRTSWFWPEFQAERSDSRLPRSVLSSAKEGRPGGDGPKIRTFVIHSPGRSVSERPAIIVTGPNQPSRDREGAVPYRQKPTAYQPDTKTVIKHWLRS
jgi:hypothetical protein